MRTILLFLILTCSSCGVKDHNTDASMYLPEITNEVLKANIVEYAKASYKEHKLSANNLIYLDCQLLGDTVVYQIYEAFDMGWFVEPNMTAIIKIDSINIGYHNLMSGDIEMSIKAMVDLLSDDYPSFKDDYALYLERKNLPDQSHRSWPLHWVGGIDNWTLKFVNDSLVSRSVYSEFDGTTKYF